MRLVGAVAIICVGGGLGWFSAYLEGPLYRATATLEVVDPRSVTELARDSPRFVYSHRPDPIEVQAGLESRTLLSSVRAALRAAGPETVTGRPDGGRAEGEPSWSALLEGVTTDVQIRPGAANLIDLSCNSPVAIAAIRVCDRLAQEYVDRRLASRQEEDNRHVDALQKESDDIERSLTEQQRGAREFAQKSKLLPDGDDPEPIRLLADELARARVARIGKQAAYQAQSTSADVGETDRYAEVWLKHADLRARLAQLSVSFAASHPDVRRVVAELAALDETLANARNRSEISARQGFEDARMQETLLEDTYARRLEQSVNRADAYARYAELQQGIDAIGASHSAVLSRLGEARADAAAIRRDVRIVNPTNGDAPLKGPGLLLRIGLGATAGFAVALAFALTIPRRRARASQPIVVSAAYEGQMLTADVADPADTRTALDVMPSTTRAARTIAVEKWLREHGRRSA